jgi:hypothetical protein
MLKRSSDSGMSSSNRLFFLAHHSARVCPAVF